MTDSNNSGFVILHFGPLGIDDMTNAAELAGQDAVIDARTARMTGANLAFGNPDLLDALNKRLEAGARNEAEKKYPGLSQEAIDWLASGERGLSSDAIFMNLTGTSTGDNTDEDFHPHDPADLRRCRLCLENVPELSGRIHEMASVSPVWARLVANWENLCTTMDAEAPDWRNKTSSAPATYNLMKRIRDERQS